MRIAPRSEIERIEAELELLRKPRKFRVPGAFYETHHTASGGSTFILKLY